jgi:hypothetical protein
VEVAGLRNARQVNPPIRSHVGDRADGSFPADRTDKALQQHAALRKRGLRWLAECCGEHHREQYGGKGHQKGDHTRKRSRQWLDPLMRIHGCRIAK